MTRAKQPSTLSCPDIDPAHRAATSEKSRQRPWAMLDATLNDSPRVWSVVRVTSEERGAFFERTRGDTRFARYACDVEILTNSEAAEQKLKGGACRQSDPKRSFSGKFRRSAFLLLPSTPFQPCFYLTNFRTTCLRASKVEERYRKRTDTREEEICFCWTLAIAVYDTADNAARNRNAIHFIFEGPVIL